MSGQITNVRLSFDTRRPVAPRNTARTFRTSSYKKPFTLGDVVEVGDKDYVIARSSITTDGKLVHDLIRLTGDQIEYLPETPQEDIKKRAETSSPGSLNYAYNLLVEKTSSGDDLTRGPF